MARTPKLRAPVSGSREGLRKSKKVEYNVQKLSDKSVEAPKEKAPTKEKKATTTPTKKKAKVVKKSGATYVVLLKRTLKDVEAPGMGLESIVKSLAANYGREDRRHIRLALADGVAKKIFVKTRASWRLSKKAYDNIHRTDKKKKSTKKATTTKKSTKKATTTKKSSTKKSSTKKSTTKKSTTTKKATTKKSSTKKETGKKSSTKKASTTKKGKAPATKKEATKKTSKKRAAESESEGESPKSPKKKVIGPPTSDASGAVSEAIGKWQYYDGGWQDYSDDGGRVVEGVYQEYQVNTDIHVRPVQSGHFSYSVNFRSLEQTNTSTGTMRKIRRI